jgi:hypothetical protein
MVEQDKHTSNLIHFRQQYIPNTGPEVDDPISLVVSIGKTHACRLDW